MLKVTRYYINIVLLILINETRHFTEIKQNLTRTRGLLSPHKLQVAICTQVMEEKFRQTAVNFEDWVCS